ncbi:MAG: ATP-binding cassette domain-containing protein [Lentisphaeria bacterium]|jgi:ABC-2 type transport system ATP-binding protein
MIAVSNLMKRFGPKVAVDGVSFTVSPGEVLGFLGPNGAGKSTTMRMITGYLPPSAGTVRVGGHDIEAQPVAAKRCLGYLPENAPVYADMTVTGFLRFCAEARGLWGRERDQAVERVIDTCFLAPVRHQPIDTLSKGYTHRTCFAQTLLHDPKALVLDEPTDGLDPNQKHEVRNLIRRMGERKAIILSTHILEEVEAVCSRVIIIDRGRIVADGTPAGLRAKAASAGTVTVHVRVPSAIEVVAALNALPAVAEAHTLAETVAGASFRVRPAPGKAEGLAVAIAELLRGKGWAYDELHTEAGRLDEVFRAVTVADTARHQDREMTA